MPAAAYAAPRRAPFVTAPSLQDTLPSRRALLFLAALLTVLWLGVLGFRDLVPTDEGRYAEIAREMVATGDWVTPRLDGFKYFEKPVLQYWATAAAYEAFGLGQWQARLWTGLTGLLTIFLTWYAGRALFGARAGLFGAAVLASNVYWVGLGHINTLDMGVAAFLAASLFTFLLAQRAEATARSRRGWMWACWASMALATLSKGLIGAAFPGMTLVLYTLLSRDWALWKRLHLVSGLVIFFALAAPWYVMVQARNPEFFNFFFIYQQFTRFLTPALSRPGPWYYFVPIVLVGMLPWLGLLPAASWRAWRLPAPASGGVAAGRVLVIWSVSIFVFFSASHSKLPSYILPIFPALALLAGVHLAQASPRTLRAQFAGVAVGCALATAGLTQLWRAGNAVTPAALYRDYGGWLQGAAVLCLAGAALAWRRERAGRRVPAVMLLAVGAFLGLTVATQAFQILGRTASTRDVVTAIRPWLHADQPFYTVRTYDQTLPFYLRRTTTVVEYEGELEFGMSLQPRLRVPTLAAFARRWASDRQPLAFMNTADLPAVRALGVPLEVIEYTPRYVVVARPDQDYGPMARAALAKLPAAWNARIAAAPTKGESR